MKGRIPTHFYSVFPRHRCCRTATDVGIISLERDCRVRRSDLVPREYIPVGSGTGDAAHSTGCCERACGGVRAGGACRRYGGIAVVPGFAGRHWLQLARLLCGRQYRLVARIIRHFVVAQSNWVPDHRQWRCALARWPDSLGIEDVNIQRRCRRNSDRLQLAMGQCRCRHRGRCHLHAQQCEFVGCAAFSLPAGSSTSLSQSARSTGR